MTQQTLEKTFIFDTLEELVETYFEESEGEGNAAITFENKILTLTTINFKDAEVKVYRVEETDELYQIMETSYIQMIESDTASGNDFWDKWAAMISAFLPYKIVDETLNP